MAKGEKDKKAAPKKDAKEKSVEKKKGTSTKGEKSETDLKKPNEPTPLDLPPMPDQKNCVMHQDPLVYFCDTCEEPVCRLCVSIGPHNNQLHRICSTDKALVDREPKYTYLIRTCLVQKRDQLIAQMHRLDYRMEEIKSVRSTIEQDTRLMFGGMLERLQTSEGHKTSILQHQMSSVQQEIESINSIIQQFVGLTNQGVSPLEFMTKAATLRQNIEMILNKSFNTEIDITPYDLPRELLQIRKEIEENNQLDMLIQMKDNVIMRLFHELKQVFKDSVADLDKAANQEIASWAALTDKYTSELEEYQRICYYCAEPLNEDSINDECTVNIDKSIADRFQGFTEKEPKLQYHGNRCHYFQPPKPEIFQSPEAFENMQRIFFKKENNPYKQSLILQLDKILVDIRKKVFKDHIDLTSILREHDKEGIGIINSITFTFLLNEYVGIPEDKIMTIIKVLDPSNKHLINFADFIRLVHDNTSLDTMPLFKLGEKLSNMMAENSKSLAERSATNHDGKGESPYFTPAANIPGIPDMGAHTIGNLVNLKPPSGPDRGPPDASMGYQSRGMPQGVARSVTNLISH